MYIRLDTGIYMVAGGKGGPGISHPKDGNVYLIEDSKEAVLIDGGSGMNTEQIIENISVACHGKFTQDELALIEGICAGEKNE